MNYFSNFYKFIIVIVIICLIFIMYNKLNSKLEKFKIVCVSKKKGPVEKMKKLVPKQINFSIDVNKDKDKITLYWGKPLEFITTPTKEPSKQVTSMSSNTKSTSVYNNNQQTITEYDKKILDYILIKYVNNDGPYINILEKDKLKTNGNLYKFVYTNSEPNIIYKFGILARNKFGISSIENLRFKNVSISIDKVDINYSKKQKLYCSNTGEHKFVDDSNCKQKKKIIASDINYESNFDNENFERLMNDLLSNDKLHYNPEINIM